MSRSVFFALPDATSIGDIRREAALLAKQLHFTETAAGRLGIVVTEIGSNILKHARDGMVLFRPLGEDTGLGIEILAVDKGPGMADVGRCLEDGYSTAGSPGTGLGAIRRLADAFDIYSQVGQGTVLLARIKSGSLKSKVIPRPLEWAAVGMAAHPTEPSGDAWSVRSDLPGAQLLLADGLGHGQLAANAADAAVRVFQEQEGRKPAEIIRAMHGPLRSTRGASLAIAEIAFGARQVHFAGLGNISGVIVEPSAPGIASRSMVSHNGTVGHEMRTVHEFAYPWTANSTLIMHSDGLLSRWKLDAYPGLLARDTAIIAGVLFRDFQRGRDDVSVIVARQRAARDPI